MKMKATGSSETSILICQSARCYVADDGIVYVCRYFFLCCVLGLELYEGKVLCTPLKRSSSGGIAPFILNHCWNNLRYPLNRRFGGSRQSIWTLRRREKFLNTWRVSTCCSSVGTDLPRSHWLVFGVQTSGSTRVTPGNRPVVVSEYCKCNSTALIQPYPK